MEVSWVDKKRHALLTSIKNTPCVKDIIPPEEIFGGRRLEVEKCEPFPNEKYCSRSSGVQGDAITSYDIYQLKVNSNVY